MIALILAVTIMTVPLDSYNSTWVTLPMHHQFEYQLDTGNWALSTIPPDFAWGLVKNYQAVWDDRPFNVYTAAGSYTSPTVLVPHVHIGACDIGTVEMVVLPPIIAWDTGLDARTLQRVEPWSFDSKRRTFTFTCPR